MKSDTTPTNWMLVVSAALLSALAVRLRCRLRQAFGGDSSGISEARRADIKAAQARPSWSESTDTELPRWRHRRRSASRTVTAAAAAWCGRLERLGLRGGSESGSDGVLRRGEVQKKLREQLRRRDEMISEMQAQVAARKARSAHLRSQLDRAGTRLAQSKGELLRLRREAADLKLLTNGWARVPSYGKLRNK
ncbi:unnamed protein product [Spirodela intermedia]|uniref:Uncharacterized protein n=1 Tax=Spirodela intermedia TaxID=51605 RepID=A0ABN7EDH0_SPIIN|nr:unnamed protein product [Spirodela intermedia]